MEVPFRRSLDIAAIAVLFLAFALQGAWPVPDVNEPHYVGKMISFWNKDWVRGDPFLESADAHPVFFAIFGWPSLFLEAETFTWLARLVGWCLVAVGWYVLARHLLPFRWQAVMAGILFGCLQERLNAAGEWVIGGIEAKVPAYGFVFLGLAAFVRQRWNGAWLCWGVASAFHVLVGGWAFLVGLGTWALHERSWTGLRKVLPGLLAGGAWAFLGLVPAIRLNWGVDSETSLLAAQIYLYRLGHHLSLLRLGSGALDKFLLLLFVWFLLSRLGSFEPSCKLFRWFVGGSLGLAAVGAALSFAEWFLPEKAPMLLRFYWFRLADVMLPAGVAIAAVGLMGASGPAHAAGTRTYCLIVGGVVALHLASCCYLRVTVRVPRADENQVEDYLAWRDLCRFVRESGQIPAGSRFLTPRTSYTFRWYARRADLVNWKDIPQDAPSIVRWWHTLTEVHAYRDSAGRMKWLPSIAHAGTSAVRTLARKYEVSHVIAPVWPPLELPEVYRNTTYVIYEIR